MAIWKVDVDVRFSRTYLIEAKMRAEAEREAEILAAEEIAPGAAHAHARLLYDGATGAALTVGGVREALPDARSLRLAEAALRRAGDEAGAGLFAERLAALDALEPLLDDLDDDERIVDIENEAPKRGVRVVDALAKVLEAATPCAAAFDRWVAGARAAEGLASALRSAPRAAP